MYGAETQVDREFWEDRLEVGADLILEQHANDHYMDTWVDGLSPRCRAILVRHLGIPPNLPLQETRQAILAHRDRLVLFLFINAVAACKRMHAMVEVARSSLSPGALEQAHMVTEGEECFDRHALMWLLYEQDPTNLELVFHLDRAHRKGFARMVLQQAVAAATRAEVDDFFVVAHLQHILDTFEKEHQTLRRSHCAKVLRDRDTYKAFIKRDGRPAFISHGTSNIFGFEREWIILDFEANLRRVHICSVTPSKPLLLANRIASAYFGRPVTYTNECITTATSEISDFIESLLTKPGDLPLVELVVRNSSLDGSPQLRLSDPENESLAPAIRGFATFFGNPLANVSDIESIKVYAFGRRVRLMFEPVGGGDSYVVRYTDQPLDGRARRAFEQMMKREYGISVLSTEKKHVR